MSYNSSKSLSLSHTNLHPSKELLIWFESLSIEQKCRVTRVTSTELIPLISKTIKDLHLLEEITNKPINTKKTKQKPDSNKILHQSSISDSLFDSLLVFSQIDFLDTIGLDFNLIKDTARMMDILTELSSKNLGKFSHKIPNSQMISSKSDISVLISFMICNQLQQARIFSKFPPDHSWRRRDIGNFWSHLQKQQRSSFLYLQCSAIPEMVKSLSKKGINVFPDALEKEIRELIKLQRNQFCNRLLKCRLKKSIVDPIKQYHQQIYRIIVEKIRIQKKKKPLKKDIELQQQYIFNQKYEKLKPFQKQQKISKLQKIKFSPTSDRKENLHQQAEQRVKSHSVSSNDTNETQSKLDLKYFGEDSFSQKIQSLFKHKITNDLIQFGDVIGEKANSFQKYRLVAFDRIQCMLSTFQVQLLLYGSCANGLMVEKSDVDVAIAHHILNYFPYGSLKDRVIYALSHLHQLLQHQPWISKTFLITTASIPVLKLQVDTSVGIDCPLGLTDENNTFKGYPQDGVKIDVDITIDTSIFKGEVGHLGLQATQLMKDWMAEIPNLYSISIFLKYLFQKKEFNSTYKGGIGSYCTMVMILAYIKYHKLENEDLATQLEGIINFFCKQFDENSKGVDLRQNIFFYFKESAEGKLQVKDPINGRVMTRSTYLYPKIKQQLLRINKKCFDNIRNQVLQHIGMIEDKQEKEQILGLTPKQYFIHYQSFYSKNIFYEYDFS